MNEFNYEERCATASEEQGITGIVNALHDLGINSEIHQTGGFTMCAYIDLGKGLYIYASPYGFCLYDSEDYETDIAIYDDPQDSQKIAQEIADYLTNLKEI